MIDLLWLIASAAVVLVLTVVPGFLAVRCAGGGRLLAGALAPALGAGTAGVTAILAQKLGVAWSALPYLVVWAVVIGALVLLRRRMPLLAGLDREDLDAPGHGPGVGRPGDAAIGAAAREGVVPTAHRLLSGIPQGPWWVLGACAVAVVPIAIAFGRPDGLLERWDALYHLQALDRIRTTGDGSSLTLGALSNTAQTPVPYPAAFHDLATLMPAAPVPVLLNAAAAVLGLVPWVLGCAILARVLWPQIRWGAAAAAIIAALAPSAPIDEWIHLAAIPNMAGMAMLPGVLAAAVLLWRQVLAADRVVLVLGRLARAVIPLGVAGLGLALLQPNVAVAALLLIAVMTAGTPGRRLLRDPWLLLVPFAALVPVAVLAWTPLGAAVTHFSGGLQEPLVTVLGQVLLGLLTVWPMALGVLIAALWWPGVVHTAVRGGTRWLVAAWLLMVVLYIDAGIDSSWNLSVLFYRGQDRLAMPLSMLTTVLAVPGLRVWADALGRDRSAATRPVVAVLVVIASLAALVSGPTRLADAQRNLELDYPGRGRYLQADEIAAFDRAAPDLDRDGVVLASPFSGASQMAVVHDFRVVFPVAGMNLSTEDRDLLSAAPLAATSPARCQELLDRDVRYIYQERRPYQFASTFDALSEVDPAIGHVVFTTDHSRLIEVDCTGTA